MRKLNLKHRRRSSYGFYGEAHTEAQARAEGEAAALNAGMSMAEWQIEQQAILEQHILGRYNAALGVLNGAGLPLENVEEGNALVAFLVENQTSPYTDKDIIDLVQDIRSQIQSGQIVAKVAFADKGRDVRPALFKLATEVGTSTKVKKKAARLFRMLEVIREIFYLQMILSMQGKPRSLQRDADAQKMSQQALKLGADLGLQIETSYTLQMFDKAERLVLENLNTISFGKEGEDYIFVSSDSLVDQSMSILSAGSDASKELFDKYVSGPETKKSLQYGLIGLILGILVTRMR